jgi:hypothetical protein
VTDAPDAWPDAWVAGWTALASLVGGARLYEAPLHLGPWRAPARWPGPEGWPADDAARERARAWGEALARAFPAPVYPRGEAGRRQMGR